MESTTRHKRRDDSAKYVQFALWRLPAAQQHEDAPWWCCGPVYVQSQDEAGTNCPTVEENGPGSMPRWSR
ncbi:hypothetical protein GGTG_01018 [Gaeumannomyces tritici R3-111a-1]|uniref:Uncharacterized protein n=1 Tax=Gaeumannomyces tritici (strain R3-111a-1) TaxID=644352 RepID=J3NID6_GAET3|nr:hypothetical protein GGTG_01018 [Gaeumannomyces tritici R3-111a-1]EJT81029.1 hypothetical protein GGTG_01018 [Gaeumannomyces tritici R3-111a-1]